jgi:hypothetical protein
MANLPEKSRDLRECNRSAASRMLRIAGGVSIAAEQERAVDFVRWESGMVDAYRWMPPESDQRARDQRSDSAAPGGPADVTAGWRGEHWYVPRDFGAQAAWGRQHAVPESDADNRNRSTAKTYRRSDERVREDVCERLIVAAELDVTEVTVDVQAGTVTLEGTVPVRRMRYMIEDIAADTAGVHEVENRIRVAPRDHR